MHEQFQSQLDALDSAINATQGPKKSNSGVSRGAKVTQNAVQSDPFSQLLRNLQRFANFQLKYIDCVDSYHSRSDINWAYSYTLQQATRDFDVISRAVDQRAKPYYSTRLQVADAVCEELLRPAQDAGLCSSGVRVITYFNKISLARVVPYANVAFIGIPWTSFANDRDLLALPHELGHFIFWDERFQNDNSMPLYCRNATYSNLPLHLKVKQFEDGGAHQYRDTFEGWIEEMCADIIGCILVRHYISQSFVELSLNHSDTELTEDDGEHPPPFIRPDIYVQVLKRLDGSSTSGLTQTLSKEWKKRIDARLPHPNDQDERKGILAELMPKINVLYDLYLKGVKSVGKVNINSEDPNHKSIANLDDLYVSWSNWVDEVNMQSPKNQTPPEPYYNDFATPQDWNKWQDNLFKLYTGIKETNPGCDTDNLNKTLQITVFAGGWTEGPCCGPR